MELTERTHALDEQITQIYSIPKEEQKQVHNEDTDLVFQPDTVRLYWHRNDDRVWRRGEGTRSRIEGFVIRDGRQTRQRTSDLVYVGRGTDRFSELAQSIEGLVQTVQATEKVLPE